MAAQHTPGPWMADDGGRVRSLAYGTVASITAAGVKGNPYTAECRDANARLIAAAPEMLAAIDEIGSALASWHNSIGNAVREGRGLGQSVTGYLHYNMGLWLQQLRAAAAQATRIA